MRRGLAFALALACAACAGSRARPAEPTVDARDLAVDFPRVGEAVVDAEVPVPKALEELSRVTWTLKVKGFLFASGVEGAPFAVHTVPDGERVVALHVPLVVKHLSWREGAGYVNVELKGVVEGRQGPIEWRVPFEGKKEVLAQNVPRLDVGEE